MWQSAIKTHRHKEWRLIHYPSAAGEKLLLVDKLSPGVLSEPHSLFIFFAGMGYSSRTQVAALMGHTHYKLMSS